jgi:hypothetical protein
LNLQKAGAATTEAANATLRSFGISNAGLAQTVSGDSAEAESIKSEIRDIARTQEGIATDRADFEKLEVDTLVLDFKRLQDAGLGAAGVTAANQGTTFEFQRNEQQKATQEIANAVKQNAQQPISSNGNTVNNSKALANNANFNAKQALGQLPKGIGNFSGAGALAQAAGGLTENLDVFSTNINDLITSLQDNFRIFSDAVDRLNNVKFDINLADTVVKIDLVGAGLLNNLSAGIKNELLNVLQQQLKRLKFKPDGSVTFEGGIVD